MLPVAQKESSGVTAALDSISGKDLLRHIQVLASDDFEGRLPGTRGEELTVAYISDQFKKLGLRPGNPDGSYVQQVPLVGMYGKPQASVQIGGKAMALKFPEDYVAFAPRTGSEISVRNSDLVFVGYGVNAPEYQWDDYKGMDLRGKTLVMLINDPQIPDPKDPSRLDEKMFKGKAMTYYGRWTYKYEMAAKLGAAAAIIVHETATAMYPYEVVVNSWSRENFMIQSNGPNPEFPDVAAWMSAGRARQIFAAAGQDFDKLKRAALSRDFKPVVLPAQVSFNIQNTVRNVVSRNVVAKIEGADPKLRDEYVIYTAHWDHLGFDPARPGATKHDKVFHGAIDNASGIATLLSFAKAYAHLEQPPRRSILFIATTAEEQGLLGAKYYAAHPLVPLTRTLADINVDGINAWGTTRDVTIVGSGTSTLDGQLARIAATQGRTVKPDARPELGGFYRADQFEFAKQGVPVIYAKSGEDFIGKPAGYAGKVVENYIAHDYHKPSDDVRSDWDFSGAVEDTRLLFLLGYTVAQGEGFPRWDAGAEFKARRDAMMRDAPR
ncbi:MAG: M28 family peptidase [Betaproteobacteria bacterium]|nr:M28 family peptidase [Betaproteobacteria bacterium]